MHKLIITVLAKDRPGIIAQVSDVLYQLDCNLENVNQMILQNEFAGFFLTQAPADLPPETLETTLKEKTQGAGLTIHVTHVEENGAPAPGQGTDIFLITTSGPDQKGLVARFSAIIAKYRANILNLKAVFKGGPKPEANVMSYQVIITPDVDSQGLFAELREKAAELDLDIRIQHRNIFDAINKI